MNKLFSILSITLGGVPALFNQAAASAVAEPRFDSGSRGTSTSEVRHRQVNSRPSRKAVPQPTLALPAPAATSAVPAETKARIVVTFGAAPGSATATLAPALYNKARVLQFELDDAPASAHADLLPLLRGGTRQGQALPGLRYTDGTGRPRPYVAAVAINGHNPYNNSVWLDPGPGSRLIPYSPTAARSTASASSVAAATALNPSDMHRLREVISYFFTPAQANLCVKTVVTCQVYHVAVLPQHGSV